MEKHLRQAILSFESDPADNDFQHGYLMALAEMWRIAGGHDSCVEAVIAAHSTPETMQKRAARLGLHIVTAREEP